MIQNIYVFTHSSTVHDKIFKYNMDMVVVAKEKQMWRESQNSSLTKRKLNYISQLYHQSIYSQKK